MSTSPLGPELVSLLKGHRVGAEVRDGIVYVPSVDRWANLWMFRTDQGTFLMELRATVDGVQVVADRWAAIGDDADAAKKDGLAAFCRGVFHVVLAALWGVLERDQVDHEVRRVGAELWDLYLGPYTTRVSNDVAPLVAPSGLVDSILAAFDGHLASGDTHSMRVYVGVVNGAVTIETLVNDEKSVAVEAAVSSANWQFPGVGFASIRWFVMARRRRGEPAHTVERWCRQG